MDSLYQRLKELDRDTFQKLCFQLLNDRHPGAGLHHVEGESGDEGLDIFAGELSDGPTIWQCKSFSHGVGESQKQQIRESLKRAVKAFSPRQWILGLSIDMDSKAYRWFERLEHSYRDTVRIGLFAASEIVHELIHRRSLRNHFFPGAAIDPIELKRLLTKTGELSIEELENVTVNNVEDYIERLKERDARFNYEIMFSGDSGPSQPTRRPGLLMSIGDGKKRIDVMARDVEALNADPLKLSLSVRGTGAEKLMAAIRAGLPQELSGEEIVGITSDLPLFEGLTPNVGQKLIIGRGVPDSQIKFRGKLTFASGSEVVEYAFIELGVVRQGIDEVEIASLRENSPFSFSFVLPRRKQEQVTFSFRKRFAGRNAREIQKYLRAISILRSSGEIRVYDLESEKQLFRLADPSLPEPPCGNKRFREFIDDLAAIENKINVSFKFPRDGFLEDELRTMLLLKTYMSGGTIPVEDFSIGLVKSEANQQTLPEVLMKPGPIMITNENRRFTVLGAEIDTGPVGMQVDQARVKNYEAMAETFRNTPIGATVQLTFVPLSPVRLLLLADVKK